MLSYFITRLLLGFAIGSAVAWAFVCAAQTGHAQEVIWNEYDTLAALEGAPDVIQCIVYYESEPHWNPYSVGAQGELGVAQLHPGGLLGDFLYSGWTPLPPEERNPFNPYQSVAYLENWGQTHDGTYGPWTTWRRYCL